MFGKAFSEALLELRKYIIAYGDDSLEPYFTALLYSEGDDCSLSVSKIVPCGKQDNVFVPGIGDLRDSIEYEKVLESNKDEKFNRLKAFILQLRNNTITIQNPGDFDELHFCLYFPLYQSGIWEQVRFFVEVAKDEKFGTDIDIVGFSSDMAELFTAKERLVDLPLLKGQYDMQTKETLDRVVEYRKEHRGEILHFIVLQNSQSRGIALALNMNSFTRIIGEFALMCIECYRDIFGIGFCNSDIQAIGLSMLSLDRFYFVEYLLQRTYLYTMDKEKIKEDSVDINKAFEITQGVIPPWINLMSDFFEREIKPRLDGRLAQSSIVTEITPLLDEEFQKIGDNLVSYITDDKLSIPEKRAILAALLGLDDVLFVNDLFSKKQLIVDDLDRQAMRIFIDINNQLLDNPECSDKALLSEDELPAVYPLDEIKELRGRLKQSSGYIREMQKEAKKLELQLSQQEDAEKCLIKDGYFVLGNQSYKLIPDDIIDVPLTDNYVSHRVKAQSVDLRQGFTDIKNQGKQGACLAFALASIYEYFLKSNQDPNPNLSEAFLYYNARKKEGKTHEDAGSKLSNAVESLVESGICIEALCPYHEELYVREPSEEAYANAKNHRVRKALNVNCTLEDIKSALEDGFPVAVSVNLYASFGSGYKGFISYPTAGEKQEKIEEHGRHAMVICGYSDENRIFIVRNSWGTGFGDKGYCYMPYSYIMDSTLINWACIITEIDSYKIKIGEGEKKLLRFDRRDANLMYAITCNLIREEELKQIPLQQREEQLQDYYFNLKQKLKNKNLQDELIDGGTRYFEIKIEDCVQEKKNLTNQKNKVLDDFDLSTRKYGIIIIGIILFIWIIGGVLYKLVLPDSLWWVLILTTLFGSFLFLYFPWRKSRRKGLESSWNEQITREGVRTERLKKENDTLHLRMHLAGMILIRLFELNDRLMNMYNVMKSFMLNLNTWYDEESDKQRGMSADTQPPFISLLRNDVLDGYFEKYKDDITKDIRLWHFLKEYKLSEEGIRLFQENLKSIFINKIFAILDNFCVYDYISGNVKYSYLIDDYNQILPLLEDLDRKSDIFLQCNGVGSGLNPQKMIFIHTATDDDTRKWTEKYPLAFSIQPTSYNIKSRFKIVIFRVQDLNYEQIVC